MHKNILSALALGIWFSFVPVANGFAGTMDAYSKTIWNYLETLTFFGPRVPGTVGHAKTVNLIKEVGGRFAHVVEEHKFQLRRSGKQVAMANLMLKFDGTEGGRPILIGTHFDTRPYADEESDPALRSRPIPGANDGGSGTAVLLGLAEYFHKHPLKRPVHLTFFDGEDFGAKGSGEILLGSTYYARVLEKMSEDQRPYCVLIIDMVGDRDLQIFKESHSMKSAGWLLDMIYEAAKKMNYPQFIEKSKYTIFDDHYPFVRLGIPSVLLIDFDYPHWHKLSDTLDKCLPESMFAVFSVVVEALSRI